jgi:hypothetical protein
MDGMALDFNIAGVNGKELSCPVRPCQQGEPLDDHAAVAGKAKVKVQPQGKQITRSMSL